MKFYVNADCNVGLGRGRARELAFDGVVEGAQWICVESHLGPS